MPRMDLAVPFAEKEKAKQLGARWDSERKLWYVPNGVDAGAFKRWLLSEPSISIRSSSYFIAQASTLCWKCRRPTKVHGLILPEGYEVLEFDEDDGQEKWYRHEEPTTLNYVTDLFPVVAARIKAFSRHYRIGFSKTTQSSYWMNHCECCGMKQGDFEMHCEPGGAFFPMEEHVAALTVLHEHTEPFGCNGAYSFGVHFFEHMQRANISNEPE